MCQLNKSPRNKLQLNKLININCNRVKIIKILFKHVLAIDIIKNKNKNEKYIKFLICKENTYKI
jgi:hypothetical protein